LINLPYIFITPHSHIQTGHARGQGMRKQDDESNEFIFLDDSNDAAPAKEIEDSCATDDCCEDETDLSPVSITVNTPSSKKIEKNESPIVDEEYYDYDECTPLASVSFTYSIPTEDRTHITQEFTHPHNHEEQVEYQVKRKAWQEDYTEKPIYQTKWKELYDAVKVL